MQLLVANKLLLLLHLLGLTVQCHASFLRPLRSVPSFHPFPRTLHSYDEINEYSFQNQEGTTTNSIDDASSSNNNSGNKNTSQQQRQQQRSIWFIDDEEPLRTAVGTYLTECGFLTHTFSSALAALEALDIAPPNASAVVQPSAASSSSSNTVHAIPDAIVSDIVMPQMSGIEFCTHLRTIPHLQSMPIILLTAKSQTADRIAGYNAGADAYIPKPFDAQELVTIVENCMNRRDFLAGRNGGSSGTGSGDEDNRVVQGFQEPIPNEGVNLAVKELQRDLEEIRSLILENQTKNSVRALLPSENLLTGASEPPPPTTEATAAKNEPLLTPNEVSVLELLCQGYMNKEIAAELQYSITWVEKHLTAMFRKTGCANRTELVRWAAANDIVDF